MSLRQYKHIIFGMNIPQCNQKELRRNFALQLPQAPFSNPNKNDFFCQSNDVNCHDQKKEDDKNDTNAHKDHKMFDLHGYTTSEVEQNLRAILTSADRSHQNVIKINVGQEINSKNRVGELTKIVKKVAKDLQLPDPVKQIKNPCYLLIILPAKLELKMQ